MAFLIRSHLLFSVKKQGAYDATDPSLLAPLAPSAAKDWIHKTKEDLAKSSVEHIWRESEQIEGERGAALARMLDDPFIKTYEKRPVLPNVHTMEVIFLRALSKKRLVIVSLEEEMQNKRTAFLFESNTARSALVLKKEPDKTDLKQPAIVIQGRCRSLEEIEKLFSSEDLFKLLMVTASQDPQYLEGNRAEAIPFEKQARDPLVQNERECFEKLNKLPKHFRILHIFCDRVGKFIKTPSVKSSWTFEDTLRNMSVNWMGDDLNIPKGSWKRKPEDAPREVCY